MTGFSNLNYDINDFRVEGIDNSLAEDDWVGLMKHNSKGFNLGGCRVAEISSKKAAKGEYTIKTTDVDLDPHFLRPGSQLYIKRVSLGVDFVRKIDAIKAAIRKPEL
eukprot:UN29537